jgi:hypothetical protein
MQIHRPVDRVAMVRLHRFQEVPLPTAEEVEAAVQAARLAGRAVAAVAAMVLLLALELRVLQTWAAGVAALVVGLALLRMLEQMAALAL